LHSHSTLFQPSPFVDVLLNKRLQREHLRTPETVVPKIIGTMPPIAATETNEMNRNAQIVKKLKAIMGFSLQDYLYTLEMGGCQTSRSIMRGAIKGEANPQFVAPRDDLVQQLFDGIFRTQRDTDPTIMAELKRIHLLWRQNDETVVDLLDTLFYSVHGSASQDSRADQ